MENRGSKGLALAALIVGVVGLTLGFAAFSASLTIESSATVTPTAEEFSGKFGYAATPAPTGGTIAADYAKSWTGITAAFDAVGQTKTFTATIKNDSAYTAYLQNTPSATQLSCTGDAATEYKTAACNEITMTVDAPATVGAGDTAEVTVTITGNTTVVDGTLNVTFNPVTLDYSTAPKAA